MIVSVFVRRLKEGCIIEDFVNEWDADQGFGVPTRVFNAQSLDDPRDVIFDRLRCMYEVKTEHTSPWNRTRLVSVLAGASSPRFVDRRSEATQRGPRGRPAFWGRVDLPLADVCGSCENRSKRFYSTQGSLHHDLP
jgi:hypothetical protein